MAKDTSRITAGKLGVRKLLYYFGKWRFQKVLNKRVLLIVSNLYISSDYKSQKHSDSIQSAKAGVIETVLHI